MGLGKIYETDPDAKKVEKEEFLRLDLACGNNLRPGFIGVDISPDTQAEYLCDLEKYPWHWKKVTQDITLPCLIPDNSVGEVFSSHYIEHVSDFKAFMEEIYRVLIPKGIVTFQAPYYASIRAMQDYTHKRFISENTFLYVNQNWLKANGLQHYGMKCDFDILSIKFYYAQDWKSRAEAAKEWARYHNINVVDDIEVILQAKK